MPYKKTFLVLLVCGLTVAFPSVATPVPAVPLVPVAVESNVTPPPTLLAIPEGADITLPNKKSKTEAAVVKATPQHDVPFYSQFLDITEPRWQKVGCGIASVAMLIDFYSARSVHVDSLLHEGIKANAFLEDAGWTHQGLINLTKQYGLDGESHSLATLTMEQAFSELETVVTEGPVMVSVHYTFDPSNPIPHLAVITGITNERVYYNDPAEATGQLSISVTKFKSAWKKRYIVIRPVA